MKEHVDTITDLMLGAAYSDKRLEGDEIASISQLLCKLLGTSKLPDAQTQRIGGFNPAKFDVKKASASLAKLSAADKRTVLELIAKVNESDETIDLDEDAYLRKVALGMGMKESEIGDLTIEVLPDDEVEGLLK
jgi:hypothetical protein